MASGKEVEQAFSAGGVVYRTDGGNLLIALCGRTKTGTWNLPKGTPDDGETIEQTALREVKEETGLDVQLTGLVGLYSRAESPVVLAVYSAKVEGGELRAGHDAREVALFDPAHLPDLPFHDDVQILKDWRSGRSLER